MTVKTPHVSVQILGVLALVIGTSARAQDDCTAKRADLAEATQALRDCRKSGGSCDAAVIRRDAAEVAAAPCASTSAAEAAPVESEKPAPAPAARARTGKVAVLVEAAKPDPLEAAARKGLEGANVLDPGAVRAARSFLGLSGELDEAGIEKLRLSVGADRLVIVQVKADGPKRFVAVKAVDDGAAAAARKFGETTESGLPALVTALVSALPPMAPPPAAAAPVAVATATPAPTPKPKPWAPPQAPQRRVSDTDARDKLEYAKKGVRVFSGDFGVSTTTGVEKPEDGEEFTTRTTDLVLRPGIAYFVGDGLMLGFRPILTTSSSNDDDDLRETDTSVGALFSGAYLSDTGSGSLFVGPQFSFGYVSRTFKASQDGFSAEFTQSGPVFAAALAVRAPVGKGGVIGFSVYGEHFPTSITGDVDGTYTFTTFGVTNTLGVWF